MIDARWFEKHQRTILKFANSKLGHFFFQYEKMGIRMLGRKIARITPNSVHFLSKEEIIGDLLHQEFEAVIMGRAEYSLKLSRVFFWKSVLDFGENLNLQPYALRTIGTTLLFFVGIKLPFLFFFNTTSTFNPPSSGDGKTQYAGGGIDYNTPHNAGSQTATDNETTGIFCRTENCAACSPAGYVITRHHFPFDTSSLGSTATISVATFSFYYDATGSDNSDGGSVSLVESQQASGTALANSDYSLWNTTKVASDVTFATIISGGAGYTDMALNSTGRSFISLTGYTKFVVLTAKDVAGTAPILRQYLQNVVYNDNGSNKPKLVVTYTTNTDYIRSLSDSIMNGASRAATVGRVASYFRALADSVMNGASRAATVARVKGYTRVLSDSVMNGASRLTTLTRGVVAYGRSISDSVMNGASRAATVARMVAMRRTVSASIMNAASRLVTLAGKKIFPFSYVVMRSKDQSLLTGLDNTTPDKMRSVEQDNIGNMDDGRVL